MRARSGQRPVAADDQALARKLRCGDGRHIALVEQRHLQGAAVAQRSDRRGAQGGDPVEPGSFEVRGDARLGNHAAVTNQDDMVEAEALFQLFHLAGQRGRIGGAAGDTSIATGQPSRAPAGRRRSAVCRACRPGCSRIGQAGSSALPHSWTRRCRAQRAAAEMALGQRRLDRGWRPPASRARCRVCLR